MPTIMRQIESVEADIHGCEEKLDRLERRLRLEEMTGIQRQSLQEEEKQWKEKLRRHEKEIKDLRKENWKSMLISVAIIGLIYCIYCLFWNS